MKFAVIILTLFISHIDAGDEAKGSNIDKFYKSSIERQAEETDSQRIQTFVRPDAHRQDRRLETTTTTPASTMSSYLSRRGEDRSRRINPKGLIVDDPIAKSESRRLDQEYNQPDGLHEPNVHESEPDEPAIVVTEIITRHNDYTTESPVTRRSENSRSPSWSYSSGPQSYPSRPSQHRSSGQSLHKTSRMQKISSTSSSSSDYSPENRQQEDRQQGEQEAQPSIPEPTNPESSIKVKDGQAAARTYFYNSRWVPKSYAQSAQNLQTQKRNQYGNSDYGQETQQFNKVAERDNEMLLVFAHSIEIPLVVASPSALRRSNNNVFSSASTTDAPVAAPRIVFITDPRSSLMQSSSSQIPKPQSQVPQAPKQQQVLTQRWGSAPVPQVRPQLRMIPLRYPMMRRNEFAYPFATDATTAAASEPTMTTIQPLPLRSYHPHHHYPNYISSQQRQQINHYNRNHHPGFMMPMQSEKLVTILPLYRSEGTTPSAAAVMM